MEDFLSMSKRLEAAAATLRSSAVPGIGSAELAALGDIMAAAAAQFDVPEAMPAAEATLDAARMIATLAAGRNGNADLPAADAASAAVARRIG